MTSTPVRRRRSPLTRRPVRIAILVAILVVAAVTVARVTWMRGAGRERWRLHDEALVLFEAERYDEAAAAYRRLIAERPGDRIARFNLGLCLVRSGDASGWAEIEAVAAADPGFDDAQVLLADRAAQQGDRTGAVRRLRAALEYPPEPPGARLRLARLLLAMGRRGAAMRHLRQIVDSSRGAALDRASAAVSLAREYGRQADLHRSPADERARERRAYGVALRTIATAGVLDDPPEDWDDAAATLGALRPRALAALGRSEEALGAIEVVLRAPLASGTRAGLHVLRAQLHWFEGDAQRAEDELRAALEGDGAPDAAVFLAAADLYESRGFRERAAAVLERGLAAHADDEVIRLSLARALFLTGRADESDSVLRAGAEVPESDAALLFLADLRRYRGEWLEARRAYEILAERRPRRLDVALRIAGLDARLAAAGDGPAGAAYAELERRAQAALDVDADDPEALLALARARLLRAPPGSDAAVRPVLEGVRDLLKRAIDTDPLAFEAHVVLAHVQMRLGAYDEAAVGLERVLAALPVERPRLRVLLSEAYIGLGAPERALAEALRAAEGLRGDRRALLAIVAAAEIAGDREATQDALERLVVLEPDELSHRLELAYLFVDAGRITRAGACFAEAERIAAAIPDEEARATELQRIADVRAEAFLRRGDVAGAQRAFDALLERYPDRAAARVALGRFLRATGRAEEAEAAFQAALVLAPDSLLPRRALVDLWADRGELTPALRDLVGRMRVLGGDEPLVLYAEGRLAALQGDLRVAREKLSACAVALADDADAQFALGVVLSRAGALEDAVAALTRASGLAPRSVRARDALARARFAFAREMARLGRLHTARGLMEGAVRGDPEAAAPRRALAELLRLTASVEVSEPEIRAMLRRDPKDVVIRRMLAIALLKKGDFEGAAREFERVGEQAPDDWTVWSALSFARLRMGDVEAAARFAERARAAAPDAPQSLAPTLQLLTETGRSAEGRRLLDAAIAAETVDASYFLLMRGILNAREERYDDVVTDVSAALELAPSMTRAAHLGVYALRYGLRSPDRAAAFARACADRAPDVAEYAFLVGWLASDAGDGGAALASLRPLAEADPPHQPALESVALILMRQGANADAREVLDRGLAVNPENPNFHYLRAQSLLADAVAAGDAEVRGSTRGAVIAALERTLELAPRHHTARNNLAFLLATDEGRLPDALEHALRATKEAPDHASYFDTLGTIQMRMGRIDAAVVSFRRALEILTEARAVLDLPDAMVVVSEPGRAERLRRRFDRQEAEVRRHYDEALRQR